MRSIWPWRGDTERRSYRGTKNSVCADRRLRPARRQKKRSRADRFERAFREPAEGSAHSRNSDSTRITQESPRANAPLRQQAFMDNFGARMSLRSLREELTAIARGQQPAQALDARDDVLIACTCRVPDRRSGKGVEASSRNLPVHRDQVVRSCRNESAQ